MKIILQEREFGYCRYKHTRETFWRGDRVFKTYEKAYNTMKKEFNKQLRLINAEFDEETIEGWFKFTNGKKICKIYEYTEDGYDSAHYWHIIIKK